MNPDLHDPATTTYTIAAQQGEVLGDGTLMLQTFAVDPESTNTTVNLTSDSTTLEYSANLLDAQKTYVPVGTPELTVDWSDLSVNAMGAAIEPVEISEVKVAQFTQSPAELEGDLFLDLELIDVASWSGTLDTFETRFDLSQLETEPGSGDFFPGITDSGTWLLALRCGDCRNPAPWYMTVLSPCTP